MSFNLSFSEFTEINKSDMTSFDTGSCHNEISIVIGERDEIVDLIFLEFKSLYYMLDFEVEEVDQKNFVVKGNYNFALSDLYLLYFGRKV